MNQLAFLRTLAGACLLLAAGLALAQPAKPAQTTAAEVVSQTRELFRKGLASYNSGQVEEAYALFQQAWALRPSSDVAMELAQCEMTLGKFALAAEHLDFAIHNFTPSINEKMRTVARQSYEDVLRRVAKLAISVNRSGAEIFVNGRSVGKAPLPGPAFADVGKCEVTARDGETSVLETVYVEAGKELPVALTLQDSPQAPSTQAPSPTQQPPLSPPKPFEPPPAEHRSIVPVLVGGAIFAVGVVGAISFKLDENSKNDDATKLRNIMGSNACGAGSIYTHDCAALQNDAKNSDRDRAYVIASLTLAGVAASATALYWYWPRSTSDNAARATRIKVSAGFAPGTSIATIGGEF